MWKKKSVDENRIHFAGNKKHFSECSFVIAMWIPYECPLQLTEIQSLKRPGSLRSALHAIAEVEMQLCELLDFVRHNFNAV